ncbi:MAG: asparagine synthase (glutamine-hydrolyzing), partial [Kiritimatiellia bacterium]
MCGITGALTLDGRPLNTWRFKPMVDTIAHRGPDDAGYLVWRTGQEYAAGQPFTDQHFHHLSPGLQQIDSGNGKRLLMETPWNLFLGHRRLSILDLTPAGHQPMKNETGRIWLVYNGEIYNFPEIKDELIAKGHTFKSRSDTEVIIHAYMEWGLDCVNRFNGMFAFALWDDVEGTLHLVRDRYGIKPLYIYFQDGLLVFGSEVKSILAYLEEFPGVDLAALNEYFSFQNVFSDRTLFEGVRLLPPGSILSIDVKSGDLNEHRYWDFDFSEESEASEDDLREELHALILQSVERQCISDVPIGSYLSGGMDSGTITALTAKHFGRIFTFTGGFDLSEAAAHEKRFDERELAEHMAALFQTEHYECVLHAGDMQAAMDDLVWHLEDLRVGQCYPNYYMSRLAGKFVKVVMSGCGGDELFGGYPWRYATAIGDTHTDYVKNYYTYWQRLMPNAEKLRLFHPDVEQTLRGMNIEGSVPFKDHTISMFRKVLGERVETRTLSDQVNRSLYFECKTFLHGLLVVEDKLSMAHSLETRVPFLDNALVDFACKVPVRYKVSNLDHLERMDENIPRKKGYYHEKMHTGKNILRKAMELILPEDITQAKKQGFSAPDESWFRGQAEDYVKERLLSPGVLLHDYLNKDYI